MQEKAIFNIPLKTFIEVILWLTVCVYIELYVLKYYFFPSIHLFFLLLLMPVAFNSETKAKGQLRAFFFATFFIAMYCVLKTNFLLWLSFGFLLLGIWEYFIGRFVSLLPFYILIILSPTLHYIVNVFTFPIRLTLSKWAGKILVIWDKNIVCKGNYFELADGFVFSVDTACMGLNMMATGLALVLLMIGFLNKMTNKILSFWSINILLLISFTLLIFANLLRIIALVLLRWLPNSIGHEILGLFILAIYVLLPMYFIIHIFQKKWSFSPKLPTPKKLVTVWKIRGYIVFLLINSWLVHEFIPPQYPLDEKTKNLIITGFDKKILPTNILQFKNDSTLLYVKPAAMRWASEHTPLLCWKASGYTFQKIETISINGYTVLKATLILDKNKLYTAWWYDNGTDKTISQWRWRTHFGEPYRLINVTTSQENQLFSACENILKLKLF